MAYEQERTAQIIFGLIFTYIGWFMLFLKFTGPSGKTWRMSHVFKNDRDWDAVPMWIDRFFKFAWIFMMFVNLCFVWDYSRTILNPLTTVASTNFPIVKFSYMMSFQSVSLLVLIMVWICKLWLAEGSDKLLTPAKISVMAIWVGFNAIISILIFAHVKLDHLVAVNRNDYIAIVAMIINTGSYWASCSAHTNDEEDCHASTVQVNLCDYVETKTDGHSKRFSAHRNKSAYGTTAGYGLYFKHTYGHIAASNLLRIYVYCTLFDDTGRILAAVMVDVMANLFMTYFSGSPDSWLVHSIFTTCNVTTLYSFFPAGIPRMGTIATAVPLGEWRHLAFFMDSANTMLQLPANVLDENRMILASIAIIVAGLTALLVAGEIINKKSESTEVDPNEKPKDMYATAREVNYLNGTGGLSKDEGASLLSTPLSVRLRRM